MEWDRSLPALRAHAMVLLRPSAMTRSGEPWRVGIKFCVDWARLGRPCTFFPSGYEPCLVGEIADAFKEKQIVGAVPEPRRVAPRATWTHAGDVAGCNPSRHRFAPRQCNRLQRRACQVAE